MTSTTTPANPRSAGEPRADGLLTADTPVGFEFIGVKKRSVIQLMATRVWGRFNPNHWDPVYAGETGLRAPIQTGEMTSAYIAEMCVNYFGRHFFRKASFQCKYIASTYAGDVITTHGVVREKTTTETGVRFRVEVWATNQNDEKTTVGWVEAEIPT
jgi:acyl dehydratase